MSVRDDEDEDEDEDQEEEERVVCGGNKDLQKKKKDMKSITSSRTTRFNIFHVHNVSTDGASTR